MAADSEDTLLYRWHALGAFVCHAFMNQFMFMNFAVITVLAKDHFGIDDAEVNWFYSAAMLASVPSFLLVMAFIDRRNWAVSLAGVLSTVLAAWIRWVAVRERSFVLGLLSSVALGPGTAVCFTGFSEFPARFFEHAGEVRLARGIATQATFGGWATGGLLAPLLVTSSASMGRFCLAQAVVATLVVPLFLWAHRPPNEAREEASSMLAGSASGHGGASASPGLDAMGWLHLVLAVLACALVQAVGFTVPAVQEAVSVTLGMDKWMCALLSFCCIMAGVFLGLLLASQLVVPLTGLRLVLSLFWTAWAALLALHLLVRHWEGGAGPGVHSVFMGTLFLLAAIGACCLGSVNASLPLVIAAGKPIPGKITGGVVELLGLLSASQLTQLSTDRGYLMCMVATLAAAILITAAATTAPAPAPREAVAAHALS